MAKKFDPTPDTEAAATTATVHTNGPAKPSVVKLPPDTIAIDLPIEIDFSAFVPGYMQVHVDAFELATIPQRAAMKLLLASLMAQHAELVNGQRVTRYEHALLWLLEQIVVGLPSKIFDHITKD